MPRVDIKKEQNWLDQTLEALKCLGYMVIENVIDPCFVEVTRKAMYKVQGQIIQEIGKNRLDRAGELGILRLMMKYDSHFIKFLELPEVLELINHTVSETAVLHLQNGFIMPSLASDQLTAVFQNQFHMDFQRVLNGYLASINTFFAIDEFTDNNGATLVVPGSHQKTEPLDLTYLQANSVAVKCPAGSMIVFDSTLWHAAGINTSGKNRLAINQQFTRSFFKQQIDYVRAVGEETLRLQTPRTQQLLGYYTRLPTSLDEYYRPEAERLYRKGQG